MRSLLKIYCPVLAIVMVVDCAFAAATNSTISTDNTRKWAWSSTLGWISCNANPTNGVVVGQYVCSGFMYSPTAGWICLGNGYPSNGIQYATNSATDYGVNHDGQGHLSGYAWCPSAGWINFGWTNATDPLAPKFNLTNGVFSGYAWGSGVGWISLSNNSMWVQTTNMIAGNSSNTNGVPDAWTITYFSSTNIDLSIDSDTDGVSNVDEYLAGTDPTNKSDFLCLQQVAMSGGELQLAWSSKQIRNYTIETKTNLTDQEWIPSGTILADSSNSTVRSIPASTQGYFRIKAVLPLH